MGLAERLKLSNRASKSVYRRDSENRDHVKLGLRSTLNDDHDVRKELLIAQISSLHLRGHTVVSIQRCLAQDGFHLTLAQIEGHLDMLKNRWSAIAIHNIDDAVAKALAEIEELKAEYWAAWTASKDAEIVVKGLKMTTAGDPSFLDGVLKCIDRKAKLLGLDSPIKIDVTTQIREMAIAAGLDPDEVIDEANVIISESKSLAIR